MSDADAVSFKALDSTYDGADPQTFRVLNADFECSADGARAYYRQSVIASADPRNFPPGRAVTNCSENVDLVRAVGNPALCRVRAQGVTWCGAERRLVREAEPARVTESPPARDSRDGVMRRVGRLQVAVRPIEANPSQILQGRRAQVPTEGVLNRPR
jgi:hypothetical protein